MFRSNRTKVIAAGVAAVVIGGGAYGIVAATSGSPATTASTVGHGPESGSGSGQGSNARSGPEPGGAVGTASSVSAAGFTLTTATGQKVTIKETSATTYEQGTGTSSGTSTGTSPGSPSVVTAGESVLVLGTTDSTTITATQVIVPPPAGGTSPGGQVISYAKGKQGSSQQVGQIPADYTQGTGTIVTGTTADQAIEAALAAYPGGVVDRVVQLGDGDYEVHYIGVNWPHHIFVNQSFQVIGANS
jgi:hypothetical protein